MCPHGYFLQDILIRVGIFIIKQQHNEAFNWKIGSYQIEIGMLSMIPYLVQQNRECGVIPECFYQESGGFNVFPYP